MTLESLLSSAPPTVVLVVGLAMMREKIGALNESLKKLVTVVELLQSQVGEVAVLRVELGHVKSELASVRERNHDLASEISGVRIQFAAGQR